MSIVTYDPFRTLTRFDRRFRNFNGYFNPETDLYEADNEFIIKINLPGFMRDEISVNATYNLLEVKAEHLNTSSEEKSETTEEKVENKWTARHVERVPRNYYRKIKFNKPLNTQDAKVTLKNGVLTVSLPISEEAKKINLNIE